MLRCTYLCIPSVAQGGVQLLQGRVSTISELGVYGGMYMKECSAFITVSSVTWSQFICLIPANALYLFCLHFVYIPRINRHLTSWREAWNKHPLRTEHNLTPEQLWTSGLRRIATSGNQIANEVFEHTTEVCFLSHSMFLDTSYL